VRPCTENLCTHAIQMLKVLTRQIIDFYTSSITPQPDGRFPWFPRLDAGAAMTRVAAAAAAGAAVTRGAAAVDEQAVAVRQGLTPVFVRA
jgi:hypothetical protein